MARALEGAMLDAERSLEDLYERHRNEVYRFVLRDVGSHEEAEDVTQAAFLNAFRALDRGERPEQPRAWLFTIARNVTRRRFRTRARRPREVRLETDLLAAPASEGGPSASDIRRALENLPSRQRSALVLREVLGLSYAEIAEELALSESAVETLLFRARRAFRERLERLGIAALAPVGLLRRLLSSGSPAVPGAGLKAAALLATVVLGAGAAVQTAAFADTTPAGRPPTALVGDAPALSPARSLVAKRPAATSPPARAADTKKAKAPQVRAEASSGSSTASSASTASTAALGGSTVTAVTTLAGGVSTALGASSVVQTAQTAASSTMKSVTAKVKTVTSTVKTVTSTVKTVTSRLKPVTSKVKTTVGSASAAVSASSLP